ncbi:kinase-like protein [Rhizodiscina lignyota]|uniref:Kinase-like protein n=1 Tax=Rhizodiscina lignyota TaxID=1504668 RepID=A0A9P4M725_9PEZI|nr:kinase-like protein [Rhizodiscina lignyota]
MASALSSSLHVSQVRREYNSASSLASTDPACAGLNTFTMVNKHINFNAIPDLAESVRLRLFAPNDNCDLHCFVINQPIFGGYNICYPIHFTDGVIWLVKIPATGTPDGFTEQDAAMLTTEARVMQLLRDKIPVPEIFAFDASFNSAIDVPYILMEYIDGTPLCHAWRDRSVPVEQLRERNCRTLQQLANAMLQLSEFEFMEGGSPQFNETGQLLTAVGPVWSELLAAAAQTTGNAGSTGKPKRFCRQHGPFKDAKSFFRAGSNHEPRDDRDRGFRMLIELFLDWIPDNPPGSLPFVLTHPDLNLQNVLVNEEGDLVGLIDWDGVRAVPRCLGNEAYPKWLLKDWNPLVYNWTEAGETENEGRQHNSPEELAFYRHIYESAIIENKTLLGSGHGTGSTTRSSLLLGTLYEAVESWSFGDETIIHGVFNKIRDAAEYEMNDEVENGKKEDNKAEMEGEYDEELFELHTILDAISQDGLKDRHLELLKRGFNYFMA